MNMGPPCTCTHLRGWGDVPPESTPGQPPGPFQTKRCHRSLGLCLPPLLQPLQARIGDKKQKVWIHKIRESRRKADLSHTLVARGSLHRTSLNMELCLLLQESTSRDFLAVESNTQYATRIPLFLISAMITLANCLK